MSADGSFCVDCHALELTDRSVSKRPVKIQAVWANNLKSELDIISSVVKNYQVIAMDTDFPGTVMEKTGYEWKSATPTAKYECYKANVDCLKLIQVGLTLADQDGNLPDLGDESYCYIWEFNFRDFDEQNDHCNPTSMNLLRQAGIVFKDLREKGIEAVKFGELLMTSGLVLTNSVSWVTFDRGYDFGYLVKCLTQQPLPERLKDFLKIVKAFFGNRVYHVKIMPKDIVGLEKTRERLGVKKQVGLSHCAGSKSLVTLGCFQKLKEEVSKDHDGMDKCANVLYGLHV